MVEYTDAKNNKYKIIQIIRIDNAGNKQDSREESEQKIIEELYRILIRK